MGKAGAAELNEIYLSEYVEVEFDKLLTIFLC
jgi:hypothetical protein